MARSLEMAFTADEVAELFKGGESVLDGFCMEDSDDDLGMNEEEGIDLASEFDNFEGMLVEHTEYQGSDRENQDLEREFSPGHISSDTDMDTGETRPLDQRDDEERDTAVRRERREERRVTEQDTPAGSRASQRGRRGRGSTRGRGKRGGRVRGRGREREREREERRDESTDVSEVDSLPPSSSHADSGSGVRGRDSETGRRGRRGRVRRRGRGTRNQRVIPAPTTTSDGWTDIPTPVSVEPFEEFSGPTVPLSQNPQELFNLFFTDEVLDLIVTETNRYASQCLEVTNKHWSTNEEEIRAYLGFCILMGVVREPEVRDYWSQSELLHYSPIAGRISRKRFEEIARYLHFVNNRTLPSRGQPGFHRLQKVKPVVDKVRSRFSAVYRPKSCLSADEAMVPFTGRSSMKQYIPKKPIRRGFKVWVLADSSNGYFLDVDVYVGRPSDGVTTENGLGERVVLQLTEQYRHKNHRVFCDNFFSSPFLFDKLLTHGIYACGTVRPNRREFSTQLRGLSLARGEYRAQQRGQLSAIAWQDKRQVTVLSTITDADSCVTVTRKEKDGTHTPLQCPTAIVTYNENMAGVDRGDQLRSYYKLRLKCMKNYNHYSVPSVAIDSIRQKKFRLQLAQELIGNYNGRQRIGRPRTSAPCAPPTPLEHPAHFPSKNHTKKRCVYCHYYRNPSCRKESRWHCADCEGRPTLCCTGTANNSDCWRIWHGIQQ